MRIITALARKAETVVSGGLVPSGIWFWINFLGISWEGAGGRAREGEGEGGETKIEKEVLGG